MDLTPVKSFNIEASKRKEVADIGADQSGRGVDGQAAPLNFQEEVKQAKGKLPPDCSFAVVERR